MFDSVLVVCVGNICRSPVGERALATALPKLHVRSAGIGALVGHAADDTMRSVAAAHGLSLDGHEARQFTPDMGARYDLILVMENGHRREIIQRAPQLAGRIMLFDQWSGAKGIADPYRRPAAFHERVFAEISAAAEAWAKRLSPKE
nr:low molecular weight phosphotyrosine protein phosphatase [uncultured Celeribacter sp.]